jgi:acyl carrier protein
VNDPNAIAQRIQQFLLGKYSLARKRSLSLEEPLLETGVLDSLGILDVVEFLECNFGVRFEDEDLTPENFETISRLAQFVEAKRNGTEHA